MTDEEKAKKIKIEARTKRAQRVELIDGISWVIQGNPNNKNKPDLHAWPSKYTDRRKAPYSVELNPEREHRQYSVMILDKEKSNRRPAVYRPISRMHYESMASAIASADRNAAKIRGIIKAQNSEQAAAA